MTINIPELCVVALVGVSGSGKSTFAAQHFLDSEVISSDFCRKLVSDDENDPRMETIRAGLSRFLVFKDFGRVPELLDSFPDPSQHFGAAEAAAYLHLLGTDHEQGDQMLQTMLDMSAGTGGLRELYAGGTAVFLRSTSPGTDMTTPIKRLAVLAARHGTLGEAFLALAQARQAFAAGDAAETIRRCSRTLELADEYGLGLLVIGAARARSMGLAQHDDLKFVAEQLIDSLLRYQSRGHWTASTLEAPLAARVFLNADQTETAARLLGAWSAAGYALNWSAEVALPMIAEIEKNPDHVAALEAGHLLSGATLCQFTLDALVQFLDRD